MHQALLEHTPLKKDGAHLQKGFMKKGAGEGENSPGGTDLASDPKGEGRSFGMSSMTKGQII